MDKEELEKQMNETAEEFEKSFEAWRKKKKYSHQGSAECFSRQ